MIAVVTGGSASGKSAFAERLACELPGPRAYVATMRHGDGETEARIARHLKMREGKGFFTVELADMAVVFSGSSALAGDEGAMLKQSCFGEMSTGHFASCGTARGTLIPGKSSITCELEYSASGVGVGRKNSVVALSGLSQGWAGGGAGFEGEALFGLDAASVLGGCRTALLEDLGNLVANGIEDRLADVLACENVVIVANEVGGDGIAYDPFTMGYIERIGALACQLGARADVVVEVVAGVPNVVKGELPCAC